MAGIIFVPAEKAQDVRWGEVREKKPETYFWGGKGEGGQKASPLKICAGQKMWRFVVLCRSSPVFIGPTAAPPPQNVLGHYE